MEQKLDNPKSKDKPKVKRADPISYVADHYQEWIESSERVSWMTVLKNQCAFFRLLYGIEGMRCLSGLDCFRADIDYDEAVPEYTIRFTNYRKDGTEITEGSQTYSFAIKEREFRLVYGIEALCL